MNDAQKAALLRAHDTALKSAAKASVALNWANADGKANPYDSDARSMADEVWNELARTRTTPTSWPRRSSRERASFRGDTPMRSAMV